MERPFRQLATGAVRLAAMSQLGSLAGGVFLAGGALVSKVFASSDGAKAAADVLTELTGGIAADLFGKALQGFRGDRNGDLEASMHKAAQLAFEELRDGEGRKFKAHFDSWLEYLGRTDPAEVFQGTGDADPVPLQYDDAGFHELWWARMEPTLLRWRRAKDADYTQLHMGASSERIEEPLRTLLREKLPAALRTAHDHVLRDEDLKRSWIAFEQNVYRELLGGQQEILREIREVKTMVAGRPAARPWNIPQPTNDFQDRPDLLSEIDRSLASNPLTALRGLGGIGKTQLAVRYAHLRQDRYAAGIWVAAETDPASSFAAAAPLFGVPVEQDQNAVVERVIQSLCAREPWLVVFDNAPSREAVRGWVRRLNGEGHVLITSRDTKWDGVANAVSVTEWDVDKEAVPFLLKRTGDTDHDAAVALARDLGGLVLALEHAVAFMRVGDGMTIAAYHRKWRERLARVPKGHEYTASVAKTLELSMDRTRTESPAAYDLLCLFAWLAPERIPKKELLEAGAGKLPEALAAAWADGEAWGELVETLAGYSLIRRDPAEGVATGYFVHRVVQQVMRDRQGAAAERWFGAACDVVAEAFPAEPEEPPQWSACELLLPHARAIPERVGSWEVGSLGRLLNDAGLYLRVRGLFAEARNFLEMALESDLRQFGPDHSSVAARRSNLALILLDLGEHGEARKQIELALESVLRQFGPDHPKVALCRSNLALILRDLREHGEARKQIELALESALRQFGPDHPKVALCRSNLAIILRDLGEHGEARKQIELALESELRQFTPDHPTIATTRNNLALILANLGERAEALRQFDLALAILRKNFEPEHPSIRKVQASRDWLAREMGEPDAGPGQTPAANA